MKAYEAIQAIQAEAFKAALKFPSFNSPHEGYAVLKEEVDELWDAVKSNRRSLALEEAIQVGAMAVRFLTDLSGELTDDPVTTNEVGGCEGGER